MNFRFSVLLLLVFLLVSFACTSKQDKQNQEEVEKEMARLKEKIEEAQRTGSKPDAPEQVDIMIKQAKIVEAKAMLRQIYNAAEAYFQEKGEYPPETFFNNASSENSAWNNSELNLGKPSGTPRFSYSITHDGPGGFQATAKCSDSYDKTLKNVSDITINKNGILEGGTF